MKKVHYEILRIVYAFKKAVLSLILILSDWKYYLKHSLIVSDNETIDKERAMLMLLYHSLEKGLSLDEPKNNYGIKKALDLSRLSWNYLNRHGSDKVIIAAIDVLHEYCNQLKDESDEALKLKKMNEYLSAQIPQDDRIKGGTKIISTNVPVITFDELKSFTSSRYSVRSFSQNKEITDDVISRAVEIAQTAPSVCNRQATRVHVYNNADCKKIIDIQLGDQGWANQGNKLFIITSNVNYFGGVYERSQPFIDGGIYSILFILGLHVQGIATCCKMYIRDPVLENQFYKKTNIPRNEIPVMLILAGQYKEKEVKVPSSVRLEISDVLTFHS